MNWSECQYSGKWIEVRSYKFNDVSTALALLISRGIGTFRVSISFSSLNSHFRARTSNVLSLQQVKSPFSFAKYRENWHYSVRIKKKAKIQSGKKVWREKSLKQEKKRSKKKKMSVDDILNYTPDEDEDLYALLGCDESATVKKHFFKLLFLFFFLEN